MTEEKPRRKADPPRSRRELASLAVFIIQHEELLNEELTP